MVIIRLNGDFGNQLFQFALGYSLVKRTNGRIIVDTSRVDKLGFSHSWKSLNLPENFKIIKPIWIISFLLDFLKFLTVKIGFFKNVYFLENTFSFKKINSSSKIIVIDGYWQSWKYFSEINDEIYDFFNLNVDLNIAEKKILKMINDVNSISLHVRRGDYLSLENLNIYTNLGEEYYSRALECIDSKIESPYFFVFSNDIKWVKENMFKGTNRLFFVSEISSSAVVDLYLMSRCKHNIIANSSFSWWGAYLNLSVGSIKLCPKAWFVDESTDIADLYPRNWIKI